MVGGDSKEKNVSKIFKAETDNTGDKEERWCVEG